MLGNARLMQGAGIDVAPLAQAAEARRKRGETVMFLGAGGKLAGIIAVADPIKSSAAEAIRKLHALGLNIVMATGDNETTAKAVASELGIDEVHAGLRPEDKLALIEGLQKKGATVAHGGRRHQRRASVGTRRCRHRHGHRRRCRHGKRRD